MDIGKVLFKYYPNAQWSLLGTDYQGLEWLEDLPKPSEEELLALWPTVEYELEYAEVQEIRRQEYIRLADPLFFGYQRGENTEQEWLDAVQAVKDAHPYPKKPETK